MAKEALNKKDFLSSRGLILELIGEIVDQHPLQQQLIAMYSSIIKVIPDFQISLSDDQVFSELAPIQLKITVSELFTQLKKQGSPALQKSADVEELKVDVMKSSHQDGAPFKIILDCLREIFTEDQRYYEMLIFYLKEQNAYAEVVRTACSQIKGLKRLRQDHLEKTFSQITQGRDQKNITDFLTVNIQKMEFENLQKQIVDQYRISQKLNGKTTTQVLFDLIKQRSNFGKFINLLKNSTGEQDEMLFTQQFLISYLLNISDTYLRTMILMTCSFFMPLPLVSYQPRQKKIIPMDLNNQGSKIGRGEITSRQQQDQVKARVTETKLEFVPHVFEELFYCFEKNIAVLAFKVSANSNKSPQGCTSFTNLVFNRSFQTHSKSFVNYGSIEIQFDYNFERPKFVPVADAHGCVEDDILERVYPLFNIFMIHSFSGLDHQQIARKHITKILQAIKNPLIFQIIHDESRKENYFSSLVEGNIVQITIASFNDLHEIPRKSLISLIHQKFLKYFSDFNGYETNISARYKSLNDFSVFASAFRPFRDQFEQIEEENSKAKAQFQDQIKLEEGLAIIRNFMVLIEQNKDKVLPMNALFQEACHLQKQMLRDISLTRETCQQFRLQVDELQKAMRESMHSPVTLEIRKVIRHKNYLGLSSIISKFTRSFLSLHLNPLIMERQLLRIKIQDPQLDDKGKDNIFKKIREITKTLEQRCYSNEFLYREYYISELSILKCSISPPSQSFNNYLSFCKLQISQGQPFEIIDGVSLQFIKEVYQKNQEDGKQHEEILVVSSIGPQSSGKSLLLNSLFGTQFLSSKGGCTRGINGCLINVKCEVKQTYFKKILVLDSQGLQFSEDDDEYFDRKLVFYMLCVSHVVLICNEGQMNKDIENMIEIAADCMIQETQTIYNQPQVNIIINNSQIDENSQYQKIKGLSNALMELESNESNECQRKIFKIDERNVFLLPNAFSQLGHEEFIANQPSHKFEEKVEQLRKNIFKFMQSSNQGYRSFYTLESWFKFAQGFWEFTDRSSRVTNYFNLEEKNQDFLLSTFSEKLIQQYFEEDLSIFKQNKIQEEISRVLQQYEGPIQTSINFIKTEIDNALGIAQKNVEQKIYDEFQKFTQDMGIHPRIKQRRFEKLETLMRNYIFEWQQIAMKYLWKFYEHKSKFQMDKTLQNSAENQIQIQYNDSFINDQSAELLFDNQWEVIINKMKSELKPFEIISEETFRYIGQNLYHPNARKMIKFDQDHELISSYQRHNSIVFLNNLRAQEEFFNFNPKGIKQSGNLFKQLNRSEEQQNYISIKHELILTDKELSKYVDFLIRQDHSDIDQGSQQLYKTLEKLYSFVDHEKILKDIQKNVLQNIFRDSEYNMRYTTVDKLVNDLINSDDPNITQQFCTMDFKVVQRIATSIDDIIFIINAEMEPYCLRVSQFGHDCLHQITQTYLVRIMEEVIRLAEHAVLFTFIKTKNVQRNLFIAKVTSNDQQMDLALARRTASILVSKVVNDQKKGEIRRFQKKIEADQNLLSMKQICRNIENHILKIVDGEIHDPFELETIPDQFEIASSGRVQGILGMPLQLDQQLKSEERYPNSRQKILIIAGNTEEKLKNNEEQKEGLLNKKSKFKKVDEKFEFTPEEIIMFYVKPSQLLNNKFNDKWTQVCDVEINRAKVQYVERIKKIDIIFQKYFKCFLQQIQQNKIQLATNIFVPETQDKITLSFQQFKFHCQKAMAIYLGLVVTNQWKNDSAIQVDDDTKMVNLADISLVTHQDIEIELIQPYGSVLQQILKGHMISNIQTFIKFLISEIEYLLEPSELREFELIGNLYQVMLQKTLGCSKMCPLCRRQCDQAHEDEPIDDRVHRCEYGHQIQGFGGNRYNINNNAIAIGCQELDETDIVAYKGTQMNFEKFKALIFKEKKWIFEDKDQGTTQDIKEKNVKIWNKIGPYICDYYRQEQGIDIKFVKADESALKKLSILRVHYILMLDNSESMSRKDSNRESPWQNLLAAIYQFIASFDSFLANNSKVSIITYNDKAKLAVDSFVPSDTIMMMLVDNPHGGKNFDPPFFLAKDLMDKYHRSFENFVLIMISDGDAGYPSAGVENILKSPAKAKLVFKAIALGKGSQSLTRMAKELGGDQYQILDHSQLYKAFIQMIPDLYRGQ